MDLFKAIQTSEPRITKGSREVLYCWPGTLAVIVRKDRTVGPYSTTGRWSRADVSHAMTDYFNAVPVPPEAMLAAAPRQKGRTTTGATRA